MVVNFDLYSENEILVTAAVDRNCSHYETLHPKDKLSILLCYDVDNVRSVNMMIKIELIILHQRTEFQQGLKNLENLEK